MKHIWPTLRAEWEGDSGNDTKSGTNGDDLLSGVGGNDNIKGLGGDDFMMGGDGKDTLDGGTGNDELNGMAGKDLLIGGDGDDRLYTSGLDTATGGKGADTFVFLDYTEYVDIADAGRATVKDFTTKGTSHDVLELVGFTVDWDGRDRGLEDGWEMVKTKSGVLLRFDVGDGDPAEILLKDVKIGSLTESHFDFGIF